MRTRVIDTYCGRSIIDPSERTLAHVLSENGYQCGAFGKWHLGDCYPSRACDMGFQKTVMHNAGGIGQPGDHYENNARWQTTSYFDPILYKNGDPQTYKGYCTDIFTNEAIQFIDKQNKNPFFAYVATNAPHSPMIVEEKWSHKYILAGMDPVHAKVYGMVENIDYNVGRLLDYLEAKGVSENTIFIFTSDHGPCPSADSSTTGACRWNAGLRDRKGTLYQGGIKVPHFIKYTKRIKANYAVDQVSGPIDCMPTLLDLCGITRSEEDPQIDGHSLCGLIDDSSITSAPPINRQIMMQWHRGDVPIPFRNAAVIDNRYKYYTPDEHSAGELYDLITDPEERHNLIDTQPERAAKMRSDYKTWLFDISGTRGLRTFDSQPIHIGSENEKTTLLTTNDWRLVTGEGWEAQNLRGFWRVKNLKARVYSIRLRFKYLKQNSIVYLSINDLELKVDQIGDTGWAVFPDTVLPEGYLTIEGWRQSDSIDSRLYFERFESAYYIELSHSK